MPVAAIASAAAHHLSDDKAPLWDLHALAVRPTSTGFVALSASEPAGADCMSAGESSDFSGRMEYGCTVRPLV
ncbi:hypothetical protein AYM40_37575 (plasmid) [Paraburkholderia phytofirmans OLGA172]|uniref:Uncharacterized protein n=1 Tax=Paraburkholderia phytofirmans OLGA172 TaxID=1417228 RepID=A0A161I3L1_9BURK|nr:hypothetical protein AYM40_37575 [Paraburkholderia phytofirmans OLGA172]